LQLSLQELVVYILKEHEVFVSSIVLKPGPDRRVDPGPSQPGAGTGPGWKKTGKEKTWYDPATRLRTLMQLVDFCFFFLLKRRHFDFFFKLTQTTWWPGQNSEPRPWTGLATKPGLKTMVSSHILWVLKSPL